MARLGNRIADVPKDARLFADKVSKADLLEALWDLAGLCNEVDSCDDESATFARLVRAVNECREAHGARAVQPEPTVYRCKRCGNAMLDGMTWDDGYALCRDCLSKGGK